MMNIHIGYLAACTSLLVGCVAGPDSEPRADEGALIGAHRASTKQFPYVGSLTDTVFDEIENGCTVTLIHPEWVITAAHCIDEATARNQSILFHQDDINAGPVSGKLVAIAAAYQHPAWNGLPSLSPDVGLIRLAEPQRDIPVATVYRTPLAASTFGYNVRTVGFGQNVPYHYDLRDDRGETGVLHERVATTVDCRLDPIDTPDSEPTEDHTPKSNEMFLCLDQTNGEGICHGDSGGPSFLETQSGEQLVAVTSVTGDVDCSDGFAGLVRLQTPSVLAFINTHVPPPASATLTP